MDRRHPGGRSAAAGELSAGGALLQYEPAAGVALMESIVRTGGARPGDKTMVDVLRPLAAEFAGSVRGRVPPRRPARRRR
ncbi:DAK2 domain-containing protein [Saccharopolyspora gloriosae]|uniref:DAK2 domain-containing protein n=1 Tax=Saccharopolyspora gloriosae TaxID=455344 RepID=UPI001FB72701|nr:DAK2 domain-containing protein [Saccharopolyspora gloriosae]